MGTSTIVIIGVVLGIIVLFGIIAFLAMRGRVTGLRLSFKGLGGEAKVEVEGATPHGTEQNPVAPPPQQPQIPITIVNQPTAATALPPPPMQTTAQLPRDLDDFTGRQKEFDELVTLLSGRGGRAAIALEFEASSLCRHGSSDQDHGQDGP